MNRILQYHGGKNIENIYTPQIFCDKALQLGLMVKIFKKFEGSIILSMIYYAVPVVLHQQTKIEKNIL